MTLAGEDPILERSFYDARTDGQKKQLLENMQERVRKLNE